MPARFKVVSAYGKDESQLMVAITIASVEGYELTHVIPHYEGAPQGREYEPISLSKESLGPFLIFEQKNWLEPEDDYDDEGGVE